MRSRGIVLFVAIVAAAGAAGAFIYEHEHDSVPDEAEPATDAAADAQLAHGKRKSGKKTSKKKTGKARGGTTRVTARSGGPGPSGGARAGGGAGGGGVAGGTGAGGGATGGNGVADDENVAGGDGVTTGGGGGGAARIKRGGGGPTGPTYESALAGNDQKVTIGEKSGPDLSDDQIAAPMRDGSFIGDCGAPDDMGVTVKVAIRMGHAVGVSVSTAPADSDVAGCIDRWVRGLSWPANPKTDSFVTTY